MTRPGTGPQEAVSAGGRRCRRCGHPPPAAVHPPLPCARCGAERPPEEAPAPRAGRRLLAGLAAPFRGLAFSFAHPRLLGWIAAPLFVNLLLFVLFVLLAVRWSGELAPDLSEPWWGWIDWLRGPVAWTARSLLGLLAAVAALLLTVLLAGAVNAPFYDLLSEKAEDVYLGIPDPGRPWSEFVADTLHALRAALGLLLVQGAVLAPLFLLSFTAVGAPVFVAAGMYFAGLSLADVTLARKRYGAGERMAWGRRRWPLVLALGVPVTLLPPLAPFAIVGATLAYLDEPGK